MRRWTVLWAETRRAKIRRIVMPAANSRNLEDIPASLRKDLEFLPVDSVEQVFANSVADRRFQLTLVATFGGCALLLAAIGVFGVTSYAVSQRTQEIGVRIALGATTADLQRRILMGTAKLAALGTVLGLLASWLFGRVLRSLLFGVTSSDPATFLAVPAVLFAVAILAGYLPARRASRLDPMNALRTE